MSSSDVDPDLVLVIFCQRYCQYDRNLVSWRELVRFPPGSDKPTDAETETSLGTKH